MVKNISQLFVAGPPVVERGLGQKVTKEQQRGSHIHTEVSGAVDNEVSTEQEAFAAIRRFLSYLPSNVYEAPLRQASTYYPNRREEELLSAIPRERRRIYNVRRIVEMVVDCGSFFE